MGKAVQFYARSSITDTRRIFSFKIESRRDAVQALTRFNVPAGWYVERVKGIVKVNERISNNHYVVTREETFIDRLDRFLSL